MSVKGSGVEKEAQVGIGQPDGGDAQLPLAQEQQKKPVDQAVANVILDALFTRGVYEEEVDLPGGRKCVFATRTVNQAKEILSRLEQDNPTRLTRYNQLYGCYCLAASLRVFDGKPMPGSLEEKIKIIELWPGPLVYILINELGKFDDKVAGVYTPDEVKN